MLKKNTKVSLTSINKSLNEKDSTEKTPIPEDIVDNALNKVSGAGNKINRTENENIKSSEQNYGLPIEWYSGAITKSRLVHVNPNDISVDFYGNKRNLTEKKVLGLVALIIESKGNSEPFYIREHPDKNSGYKYQAITGKRRTLASKIAKTKAYCMHIEASDTDAIVLASHENERMDFTIFERADQIQELINVTGNKTKAIELFNKNNGTKYSRSHTYDLILPSKVPDELRKIIDDSGEIKIPQVKKLLSQMEKLNEELDMDERSRFLAQLGRDVPILNLVTLIKEKISSMGIENKENKEDEAKETVHFLSKTGKSIGYFDYNKMTLKLSKNSSKDLIEEFILFLQNKAREEN